MFCHRSVLCCVALVVSGLVVGCTTPRTTNTARTAVEQLLISNAVDQSLDKVDFRPFTRQTVYLSDAYIDSVDKPYVVGSVRHRLLTAGARLVDKPEDALIIVEVRSGGVGTDTASTFIGTPEFALPGMLTVPEMKIAERSRQTGIAKIGLVAYDAKTREVLGSGGTSLAQSTDSNWFVGGVGPFQRGTIKEEVSRSTSGGAAMKQTEVPKQVAFAPSRSAGKSEEPESEIQFASGSEPAKE
jgi:hypothetical protein